MISSANAAHVSPAVPLAADDLVEFHSARLILLIDKCGEKPGQITGLTKLAKLDFFLRYPQFFSRICEYLGNVASTATKHVESVMVRHHYGPWDKRYYQVLSQLEAKELLQITKRSAKTFMFELTPKGRAVADHLSAEEAFSGLVAQAEQIHTILGKKSGNQLKELIYKVFDEEVKQRPHGKVIE